ncbi:ankyrin repeat-containing domain protein [Aspergillus cavernicola]|uniref:Ankyrin repeat-containing domain protein n=1 Tax=Aspergillus cavernicola TaxID=176166 RepID=A0ABR4I6Z9_9EURO
MPIVNLKTYPPHGPQPSIEEVLQVTSQTPVETINEMKAACAANDLSRFKSAVDDWKTHGFKMYELDFVMKLALKCNNFQIVSTLIANGLDQYHAVNDEDMLLWLLDHGADPNRQCLTDITPTSMAVWDGPISALQLLFDHGADINKRQLLHHAVERKSDEIPFLAFLLERGASINKKKSSVAFRSGPGKLHVVQYFLDQGADLLIRDLNEKTALDRAVKRGHTKVAHVLQSAMEEKRPSSL